MLTVRVVPVISDRELRNLTNRIAGQVRARLCLGLTELVDVFPLVQLPAYERRPSSGWSSERHYRKRQFVAQSPLTGLNRTRQTPGKASRASGVGRLSVVILRGGLAASPRSRYRLRFASRTERRPPPPLATRRGGRHSRRHLLTDVFTSAGVLVGVAVAAFRKEPQTQWKTFARLVKDAIEFKLSLNRLAFEEWCVCR
jgi:hypothetical protein